MFFKIVSWTKSNWLILMILFTGLFLRIFFLFKVPGLEGDEITTIAHATGNIWNLSNLKSTLLDDLNPPLYLFLLHYWMIFWGNSEAIAKSLSILFGITSVYIIYRIGRDYINKSSGLIAALLLSLSTFNIFYSQQIRMYSFSNMLALASVYFFLKILQDSQKKYVYAYWGLSLLLVSSHTFAFSTLVAQGIYLAYLKWKKQVKKDKLLKISYSLLIILLIFIPWIWVIYKQKSSFPTMNSAINPIVEIMYLFGSWPVFIILIGLSIVALLLIKKTKRIKTNIDFFASWFAIIVCLLPNIVFLLTGLAVNFSRVLISATSPLFLLAAFGLGKIGNKAMRSLTVFILIILMLDNLIILSAYVAGQKDWFQVFAETISSRSPAETIIIVPGWNKRFLAYYLPNQEQKKIISLDLDDEPGKANLIKFKAEINNFDNFWLITSGRWRDQNQIISRLLEKKYLLKEFKRQGTSDLYFFETR